MPALLGAFRLRSDGQASTSNYEKYVEETLRILSLNPLDSKDLMALRVRTRLGRIERGIQRFIRRAERIIGSKTLINGGDVRFDHVSQKFKLK